MIFIVELEYERRGNYEEPYVWDGIIEKMNQLDVPVYLVNTGWVGASAQSGSSRISLPLTRKIIHKILDGSIEFSEFVVDKFFGFKIPVELGNIDPSILNPLNAWSDKDIYNNSAKELVLKFQNNYKNYDLGDDNIRNGGPL